MDNSRDQALTVLHKFVKDIKFAMLTTHAADNSLVSRPMTTQAVDDDGTDALWFFVSKSGSAVKDITSDHHVGLSYSDPDNDTYVSVAGIAVLDNDLQRKQALWSPFNQAWFPDGPTDPDLALLRVDITHAHYWDVEKNKLTQLFDMAKASLTGTPPKDIGDSVEVPIQR